MMYEAGSLTYVSIHHKKTSADKSAAARLAVRFAGSTALRLGKLAGVLMLVVILFAGFAIVQSNAAGELAEPAAADETLVVVASGESLWEIARRVMPEEPDTRKTVYQIKKRNGLSSSSVQVGQTIIVPTKEG